ncbi:MAG TPA: protein kinase [Gaiellaceae bacterium]|nr:protein kinase [Gaiellaceae bacterium]
MAGDIVADRYELEQLVGSGGMSSVFRARDRELERTVALKILHERLTAQRDVVERFSREAKLAAGLSHHNIVAVIERGDYEGTPYIVFEYISGENLKQLVGRDGPLPVERALELAIEIARALSFAHQNGFVHRDVKPQNVLLNGNGEAKVTDFGIARAIEAHEGETQTGTVLGTCDYISPEQAQGRRVDERTDVYSLGIVLYELLTGDVPFTGDNFVAVAMQHINAPSPPVTLKRPEVPRRVEAAIDRALAKDPERRFATMEAFCNELEACLAEVRGGGEEGATGVLPVVKPPRAPRRRRRRWLVALAVVLAIAAAALAYSVFRKSSAGGSSTPIPVKAVISYDPYGDNRVESPALVPLATDGKQGTAWSTEVYNYQGGSLNKPGVGIVLDAGAPTKVREITVTSDTPGYTAVIKAGPNEDGPYSSFVADSSPLDAGSRTTFHLAGADERYYLLWITNRGRWHSVHINEVTAGG